MNIRPFRLLSATEINHLAPRVQALKQSLSEHGEIETIELSQTTSAALAEPCLLFYSENYLLAAISKQNMPAFQKWLLNNKDEHEIYQKVSEQVITKALKAFFNVSELIIKAGHHPEDWFYRGSPCLEIHLKLRSNDFNLYINPQWINQQALPLQEKKLNLAKLSDCLGNERIELNLQFTGFELSLQELAELNEGDVIELDHSITMPLILTINNKPLSPATLGSKQQMKAIKLRGNHV